MGELQLRDTRWRLHHQACTLTRPMPHRVLKRRSTPFQLHDTPALMEMAAVSDHDRDQVVDLCLQSGFRTFAAARYIKMQLKATFAVRRLCAVGLPSDFRAGMGLDMQHCSPRGRQQGRKIHADTAPLTQLISCEACPLSQQLNQSHYSAIEPVHFHRVFSDIEVSTVLVEVPASLV